MIEKEIIKTIYRQQKAKLLLKNYVDSSSFYYSVPFSQPINKTIFQFWDSHNGKLPYVVKLSFTSVRKFAPDWNHIILNLHNIHNYLDLPGFLFDKLSKEDNGFNLTFFSDIVRVALLQQYGGLWLDATVLIAKNFKYFSPLPLFFSFYRDLKPKNFKDWENYNRNYFSWTPFHEVNLLNSILWSTRYYPLWNFLYDSLINFWKENNYPPDYFMFQILFEIIKDKKPEALIGWVRTEDLSPHLLQRYFFDKNFPIDALDPIFFHKLTYLPAPKPSTLGYEYFIKNELTPHLCHSADL